MSPCPDKRPEAAGFPAAEHWKIYLVTMVISFISVVPFIIYAEVKRKMKRVFLLCVAILLIAEIVLWGAGGYFWELVAGVQLFFLAFNLLEALLPSLISKESPAGYKGTAMGVYSTSQFLGVAIGGALGGWVDGFFDSQTVFLLGALLAMLWLLVASAVSEPPYVSSLRVEVPDGVVVDSALQARLLSASGVHQALVVPEERSVYIKIDSKVTNRFEIEQLIKGV
ncbi:MFS transporter [Klebsiella pneumoniae]